MMNIVVQENCLSIQGAVTVQTLTASDYKHFQKIIQQPDIAILDLSGVGRADSACMALILEATRVSGQKMIRGLPDSVRALATLYELETWLASEA